MPSDYINGFLESDTEIYNTLLDARKGGHPLLKHFNILYPEKVPISDVNAIYVGRLNSNYNVGEATFEAETWDVTIEIVITTKQYDHLDRRRTLKSVGYAVKKVLSHSPIGAYIKFNNFNFEYDQKNVIQQARWGLTVKEYDIEKYEEELLHVCRVLADIDIYKKNKKTDKHKHKKKK